MDLCQLLLSSSRFGAYRTVADGGIPYKLITTFAGHFRLTSLLSTVGGGDLPATIRLMMRKIGINTFRYRGPKGKEAIHDMPICRAVINMLTMGFTLCIIAAHSGVCTVTSKKTASYLSAHVLCLLIMTVFFVHLGCR